MQSQLLNEWKVWFSYLTEEEHNASQYFDKLQKVFTLSSLPDLFYLWKKSPLASLSNYFLSIENEKAECFKYKIGEDFQIINSISFFKNNIEPTWEDKANANGGRLVFQIERNQENYQEIYEALIFYFVGEKFPNYERINGVRFISSKPNNINRFFYRVEIWVDFNESETEKVKDFRNSFEPFLEKYKIHNLKPLFKTNHIVKEEKGQKTEKKDKTEWKK